MLPGVVLHLMFVDLFDMRCATRLAVDGFSSWLTAHRANERSSGFVFGYLGLNDKLFFHSHHDSPHNGTDHIRIRSRIRNAGKCLHECGLLNFELRGHPYGDLQSTRDRATCFGSLRASVELIGIAFWKLSTDVQLNPGDIPMPGPLLQSQDGFGLYVIVFDVSFSHLLSDHQRYAGSDCCSQHLRGTGAGLIAGTRTERVERIRHHATGSGYSAFANRGTASPGCNRPSDHRNSSNCS